MILIFFTMYPSLDLQQDVMHFDYHNEDRQPRISNPSKKEYYLIK